MLLRRVAPLHLLLVSTAVLASVGCKGVDKGQRSQRTVKASIATFDENADIELAIGDGGGEGERPDDYDVQQRFSAVYPGLDACVAAYKERHKMKPESQLEGDVDFAIKLDGGGKSKPLGVNAVFSSKKLDNDEELKACMRDAVGNTDFPVYSGPHIVAKFSTQVDAGSAWEE